MMSGRIPGIPGASAGAVGTRRPLNDDPLGGTCMTDPVKTHRLIFSIPSDQDSLLLHPIFSDAKAMAWFGPERVLSLEEPGQWV